MSAPYLLSPKHVQSPVSGLANDASLASIAHQIAVFDEKVRKFKDGYSVNTARPMFSELARLGGSAAHAARSIASLRALLADRRVTAAPSGGAAEQVRQYFAWYLKNVDYAAELKRNFDKLIHAPLSRAVAETDEDDRPPIASSGSTASLPFGSSASVREQQQPGARPRVDGDRLAKARAALLSFADDVPEVRELYDRSELDAVSARLDRVRSAWSRLAAAGDGDGDEADVDPRLFSAESGFASARPRAAAAAASEPPSAAAAAAWLETWVRLLPDVAIKCEKASALALRLLESTAERRPRAAETAVARARKLGRARGALEERLRAAERSAEAAERRLEDDGGDLETVLEREERSALLGASLHALAQDAGRLRAAVDAVRRELDDTTELLGTAQAGTDFRDKLTATARLKRRRLLALEQTLACVDYQRRVAEEDLALELNVKPSIIQFTNHLQERCERLEQDVERAQDERSRLSLALGLLERDESRLLVAASGRSAAAAAGGGGGGN